MSLRAPAIGGIAALAAAMTLGAHAGADPVRWQRRGVRRAGITFVTVGISSAASSVALWRTTRGREHYAAAAFALTGAAFGSAGAQMWLAGERGRPTTPENPAMMYAGLIAAELGMAALPVMSALVLVAISDEPEADRARDAALATGIAAHSLIAVGIPLWANGARSPVDDQIGAGAALEVGVGPGGAGLSLRF